MIDHDFDFNRASKLLDIVQKQASVAPQYMAISSIAMMEIKEMNEEAQTILDEIGQQRLHEEQQANAEAEQARLAAEPNPVPYVPETDVPQFPDDTAPVTRRV